MKVRRWLPVVRSVVGTAVLIGMALVSASSAAAQSGTVTTEAQCAGAGGQVNVNWLAISPGATIVMDMQEDGTYSGPAQVRVYCRNPLTFADLGDIEDATVLVQAYNAPTAPTAVFLINGVTGPVTLGPFTGPTTFTISSPTPNLHLAVQPVGAHIEVLTSVTTSGGTTQLPTIPLWGGVTFGQVWNGGPIVAQTPELGSMALFGSGAVGMAGYVMTRLRAGRRRDQSDSNSDETAS